MKYKKYPEVLPWDRYQHRLQFFKIVVQYDTTHPLREGDTCVGVRIGKSNSRPKCAPLLEPLMQLQSFQEIYEHHGDWVERK